MSALARYFQFIGKNVSGYDKTPTMLTDELIAAGIKDRLTYVHLGQDLDMDVKFCLIVFNQVVDLVHGSGADRCEIKFGNRNRVLATAAQQEH